MNKMRRKEIYTIINKLNAVINLLKSGHKTGVVSTLSDISEDIEFIYFEEEEYKDNIPENLQGGYRYESAEEACDNLESAKDAIEYIQEDDSVEDIISAIDEAIDYLNDASC